MWRKARSRVRWAGEHVVAHGAEVEKPGAAGIDSGGRPRREACLVGVDCRPRAAVVKVAVQVDETWSNQLSGHVDGYCSQRWVDPDRHLRHRAVLESDVPAVVKALSGVEKGSPGQYQIVSMGVSDHRYYGP